MGTAKRLLPTFLLDKLILWLAARENKRTNNPGGVPCKLAKAKTVHRGGQAKP